MRPIPLKLRSELSHDPYYKKCVISGLPNPEWHHAFCYGGKQINEKWNIIPVAEYYHRGAGFNKHRLQLIALERSDLDDLQKRYPKKNWRQEYNYLKSIN